MPWYVFAALTPTFYSFSVFTDKFLIEKKIKDPFVLTVLLGVGSGIVGIILGIITGFQRIGFVQTGFMLFAGMLLLLYLFPYFKAMKIDDASRVIPLYQFIPVITLVLSAIFLKETLTFRQIIGLLIVVAGTFLISLEKIEGNIFRLRKSLWLMLLSSLMYGSIGIFFRFVVKNTSVWTTLSYEYIGTGITAILLLLFVPRINHGLKKDLKGVKSSLPLIAADKSLGICAQISEGFAISLAAVPLVNVVESIQPVLMIIEGIIFTMWFPHIIKENIRKETIVQKLISILLIFFGLYLVNR